MSHDICGYNIAGEEIAYARFTKNNPFANMLYSLLEAWEYNGGVSGIGSHVIYSLQQMEKAKDTYRQMFDDHASFNTDRNELYYDQKQILAFIENCMATAQEEGSVSLYFG
ncbi:hypothetical protein NC661_04215 [Aquibacillus koreensis]|uniref:Uncharacterized protein n=1 Tax=Aquibacillus koreensis TaxID=279446 RepID=A0A9X3WGY1_9BACI|nr:hypothetical protein [Aquibacillus koreensis]MCT2534822.1 hypothetical protein [Aquibacillus koreensis]MDC3419567.1 hypothetical protein [Aquibacillus koreensis]